MKQLIAEEQSRMFLFLFFPLGIATVKRASIPITLGKLKKFFEEYNKSKTGKLDSEVLISLPPSADLTLAEGIFLVDFSGEFRRFLE